MEEYEYEHERSKTMERFESQTSDLRVDTHSSLALLSFLVVTLLALLESQLLAYALQHLECWR